MRVKPRAKSLHARLRNTVRNRAKKQEYLKRTAHVISSMRAEGISLRRAAHDQGISPQTVLRHGRSALRKNASGQYRARTSDKMLRVLVLPTPQGLAEIATRDSASATMAAEYWNAVQHFLETGDESRLRRYRGKTLTDASGWPHALLTDPDELERLGSAGVLSFESLYARAS